MVHFELNGEAVRNEEKFVGNPAKCLQFSVQSSILSLGYRLAQSARKRVGSALFCNTGTIISL